jgi:hypothetical protein
MDLNLHLPRNNQETHEKFANEVTGIIAAKQRNSDNQAEALREVKKAITGCFYVFSTVCCPNI